MGILIVFVTILAAAALFVGITSFNAAVKKRNKTGSDNHGSCMVRAPYATPVPNSTLPHIERKKTFDDPLSSVEATRIVDTLSRKPPEYNLAVVASSLDCRYKEFLCPSYGTQHPDPAGDRIFSAVYATYQRAQDLEKQKESRRALDYYLFILLTCVPLGDSYYVRPAILLERFKCYDAALAVCRLRKVHMHRDGGGSLGQMKEAWKKREERLKKKIKSLA